MGLAANPSVTESEMLLYVHATVAPFLLPQVLKPAPPLARPVAFVYRSIYIVL